jgi:putative GTP pyrophosphokinase
MQRTSDHEQWYSSNISKYQSLASETQPLIEKILKSEDIDERNIQSITNRHKEWTSFEEKIRRKGYKQPEEMTDLAGARIITYTNSDVKRIRDIIKDNFIVDDSNSVDKSEDLGTDRVGYKSIHLVVTYPDRRTELPEYAKFKGLYIEIQIRTGLQHAWAEVEHDRNYKFGGELPKKLERRLMLVAGILELCDNEFDHVAKDIEDYTEIISENAKEKKLEIEINTPSLRTYLTKKFSDLDTFSARFGLLIDKDIIRKLHLYGINTLADLDEIIPSEFKDKYMKLRGPRGGLTLYILLTHIMVIHDFNKYFSTIWTEGAAYFDAHDYLVFETFGVDTSKFPDYVLSDCRGL